VKTLKGKVALVTGASRGIGKGIALGLGENGATVYVTGRTTVGGAGVEGLEGSINETAEAINEIGGTGFALCCDHTDDNRVKGVFECILERKQRLDILVNNVWGGYESMFNDHGEYIWEKLFWEQSIEQWELMFSAGVRAHYVACRHAAQIMINQRHGLIVNLSHWAAQKYSGNVCYGISKAATDKLSSDAAQDLKPFNVSVISLYPGLVRTERIMRVSEFLDLSNSESPQYIGRVIAALYTDPTLMERSGKALIAAQLGFEYGISDIDGKIPKPLSIEDA
jgi:NAD(P)-dependent dehydrogenase (short-subunit alcohol dehydrogenase family)